MYILSSSSSFHQVSYYDHNRCKQWVNNIERVFRENLQAHKLNIDQSVRFKTLSLEVEQTNLLYTFDGLNILKCHIGTYYY